MKDKKFIITKDEKTYRKLKSLGFQEVSHSGDFWYFLNDNKINFSLDDVKDVCATNTLHF